MVRYIYFWRSEGHAAGNIYNLILIFGQLHKPMRIEVIVSDRISARDEAGDRSFRLSTVLLIYSERNEAAGRYDRYILMF